jgi:cell division protein FtsZ
MSNQLFSIDEKHEDKIAKIRVIGVGGGGGNMINYMIHQGFPSVDLMAANTDAQALNASLAPTKIQLGAKLTRGLGAGMKPEKGYEAAEESYDELVERLRGSDLVFIATGLGGGTGTGASSVVARAAKEAGAITVAVCTKPFTFEGPKRSKLAKKGYEDLKAECDSMVVIPNDKLLAIIDKNMGYNESFQMVDDVLAKAVSGITSIVMSTSTQGINTDFADLQTILSYKGLALMGMGHGSGSNAAMEAVKKAIESPLLDEVSIHGAMGILVHFQIPPSFPLVAINESMSTLYESADEDADIIFGTTVDEKLEADTVKVTLIATGFEKQSANNVQEKSAEMVGKNVKSISKTLKVVGGYDLNENEDYLDIPTFLRQQMD